MNHKKTIFFLIDGARPDVLERLISEGKLPNISRYLKDEGSYTRGSTCFPSTTGPAYLPFLTGRFPGEHDITGIRWFDKLTFLRKGRWHRNSMRSYCGYEAKFFNDDMNSDYPSIFEKIDDGINIYNMITKGVSKENDITAPEKTGLYFKAHFQHKHHAVDHNGHKRLMESLKKDARFTFVVFPSIDWDSHTYHFDDPQTTHKAYKIADDSLGEAVEFLKNNNTYENTLITMASDHGLSATHSHFDLGDFFRNNKYRVLEYPRIFQLFPQVAVFISGNSFASISFLDHKNILSYNHLTEKQDQVINILVSNDAVDFVIIRNDKNEYRLINDRGYSMIKYDNDKFQYSAETTDVLSFGNINYLSDQECYDLTFESDYPDALFQIHQLMSSPRAGDLIVSAKIGYDLRDFWEFPEHKGSHGSLHREHMHIPILTNQPDLINQPSRSNILHSKIIEWQKLG